MKFSCKSIVIITAAVSVLFCSGFTSYLYAAASSDRGVGVVGNYFGKKRALVIGINNYPTMPLEAAVADGEAVAARLRELNFEVTTLFNEEATIDKIRFELGTRLANSFENDQVLIYFAGHGITESLPQNSIEGYILPVDANLKDIYSTAISMSELRDRNIF